MTEWYLLPGMGATSEMYKALRRELPFHARYLEWPKYRNDVSYRGVAERLIAENKIGANAVIGGSSLGGMVALEIGMLLNAKAVVLMGSALNRNEINILVSVLSPLAGLTPFSLLQTLAGKKDHILSQMFSASDPDFIRSMCTNLLSWPGYRGPREKIFRIHGRRDHIIACPEIDCDVIEEAGHLLVMTHAKACAAFLEKTDCGLTRQTT